MDKAVERREDVDTLPLLGRGWEADVYALDDTRVLRRCRNGEPGPTEVRLMRHVCQAGYPAPLVYEASGTDIVMERLNGPSLTQRWLAGGEGCGALLADLHNRLHALPAPDWLPHNPHRGGGDRIAHMDLHPDNVILAEAGPVVIDWAGAVTGEPAFDVAMAIVVLAVSSPEHLDPAVLEQHRQPFIEEFTANVDHDPQPFLASAIRYRMHDPNVGSAALDRLRDWLTQLS